MDLASGLAFRSGLVPGRDCRSALDLDADFRSAWDSASPLASDSVRDSESGWESEFPASVALVAPALWLEPGWSPVLL